MNHTPPRRVRLDLSKTIGMFGIGIITVEIDCFCHQRASNEGCGHERGSGVLLEGIRKSPSR